MIFNQDSIYELKFNVFKESNDELIHMNKELFLFNKKLLDLFNIKNELISSENYLQFLLINQKLMNLDFWSREWIYFY